MRFSSTPVYNFFALCVIAPVFEELVFRKLLLDRISVYGDKIAILLSGIAFGLFHGNFYQFFYAALLGTIFAWVDLRSGKLTLPILLHFFINFLGSVIAPYVQKQLALVDLDTTGSGADMLEAVSDNFFPMIISLVYTYGLLVLAIMGVVFLIRKKSRSRITFAPGTVNIPRKSRFNVVALNVGTVSKTGWFPSCISDTRLYCRSAKATVEPRRMNAPL